MGRAIRTARLRLDPLRVADAQEMVGVLADPALYVVIGGQPPDVVRLRERYQRLVVGHSPDGEQQWLNWIVRDHPTHPQAIAVGTMQATVADRISGGRGADVAWIIGVPWQGFGYACEAAIGMVNWLRHNGVDHITAYIHPEHRASQAVARAVGLMPEPVFHDGEQRWSSGGHG